MALSIVKEPTLTAYTIPLVGGQDTEWLDNTWIVEHLPTYPDYTSESSPRSLLAEVEKKIIADYGIGAYGDKIAEQIGMPIVSKFDLITASAEQRCRAIVRLIEGE